MSSSIYISPERIEVIGFSGSGSNINIQCQEVLDLPTGVIINGTIIDGGQLLDSLKEFVSKKPELFKDAILTIDGNSIISKRLTVPKLNKKQYNKLVRDDFADAAENFDELLCGYRLLNVGGGTSDAILACGTSKANVDSYLSIFEEAGIKLKSVRIGVEGLVNYVANQAQMKDKIVVINLIDGFTMLSVMFENGVNVFMSRTRLYGETFEEYAGQINENLSGLIQFSRAQNTGDIRASYYIGISSEDVNFLRAISHHGDLPIEPLDILANIKGAENIKLGTHFAFLGATLPKKSIDFIQSLKELEKSKKPKNNKIYLLIPIVAIVLFTIVNSTYILVKTSAANKEIMEITEFISSPTTVAKIEEIDALILNTNKISRLSSQLNDKITEDLNKGQITNDILDLIINTNGTQTNILNITFEDSTKIIKVSGESISEIASSAYVEELRRNSLISSVRYTGYSYSSNDTYNFVLEVEIATKEVE